MNTTSLASLIGFLIALAAGIGAIVAGVVSQPVSARFIAFGVWAVVGTILAWVSGAVSKPRILSTKPLILGADVTRVPLAPWLVIAGLFIVPVVIGFVEL